MSTLCYNIKTDIGDKNKFQQVLWSEMNTFDNVYYSIINVTVFLLPIRHYMDIVVDACCNDYIILNSHLN